MKEKILKKWTKKDIKKLIYMKDNRYSLKEISKNLNVSINAVSKALARYHEKYVRLSQVSDKEAMPGDCHINNTANILSMHAAITIFNKQAKYPICCYGEKKLYSYNKQEDLSSVSIMIIMNQWRKKRNLRLLILNRLDQI